MYQYWGFGLHISSEIEFPELFPFTFEVPDVVIRLGETPKSLPGDEVTQTINAYIKPAEYLLTMRDIGRYHVINGNQIIVEQIGNDNKSLRVFLLSNAMAAVLYQRNMIPLHASGVLYKEGVVLFSGHSRSGKSTIATSLKMKGYSVFSDDVCVLKEVDGKILAMPSYPMLKLWEDSFAKTGLSMEEAKETVRPGLAKYAHFFHHSFITDAIPVRKIFLLNTDNPLGTAEIVKPGFMEAFTEIQKNSYRPSQLNAMGKRKLFFSLASGLVNAASVYMVRRNEKADSLEQITKEIITILS